MHVSVHKTTEEKTFSDGLGKDIRQYLERPQHTIVRSIAILGF